MGNSSVQLYKNGASGESITDACQLWLQFRRQVVYEPQRYGLPWAFLQISTRKEQEKSLQLHAEKKALGVLLLHGEAELDVSINFNACMDCHEFFKVSSQLFGRMIQLRQPKMIHAFNDGCCSCADRWRWEAMFTPAKTVGSVEEQKLDVTGE